MKFHLGLRPHFEQSVPGSVESLAAQIKNATSIFKVTVAGSYIVIAMPDIEQHFWSPQMQLNLEEQDGSVTIHGLITPMPAVWTMFAIAYLAVIVLGFFGTIYGMAAKQLGASSLFLWSGPAALALLGLIYAAAHVGQRLGRAQTVDLQHFLERALFTTTD